LLDGDWVTFEFDYCLDLAALVPHIVAIESYKEAAYTRVLPRRWLEPSNTNPDSVAEGSHQPDSPAGHTLQENQALQANQAPQKNQAADASEEFAIKSAVAAEARAWAKQRFFPGSAPLSLDDIFTMHRMVGGRSTVDYNRPGVLRTLPVQVGRTEVGGLHMGAPAGRLPLLMEQYIQFINSEKLISLPAVVRALLAHFFFDTLHPFDDGNGRMSRLMAASILFQHGYNVHGGYGLSNYFYQNDIQYHTLLHRAWRRCPFDVTPFVAFGMEGLVMELKSINSFIKMKLNRIVDRDMVVSSAAKRTGGRRGRLSERGQWV
jgi:hypothetical protein